MEMLPLWQVGHLIVDTTDGLHCACGQRGCLEQYASGPALARHASVLLQAHGGGAAASSTASGCLAQRAAAAHASGGALEASDVAEAAAAGDAIAIEVTATRGWNPEGRAPPTPALRVRCVSPIVDR